MNTAQMIALLKANTQHGRRRIDQVFRDFCAWTALSFRNAVDLRHPVERIRLRLELAADYTHQEQERFDQLLQLIVDALDEQYSDVLGELYQGLDLGNKHLGQFFTPYEVSLLSAKLTLTGVTEHLQRQDFITLGEPACGSGGMIVAAMQVLREEGINFQRRVHVSAQDLDLTAVHMTYIHLTLLGVPAVISHGDTLTGEVHDHWPTPAHVLGLWDRRIALQRASRTRSHSPASSTGTPS